jgi:hypothetical protein
VAPDSGSLEVSKPFRPTSTEGRPNFSTMAQLPPWADSKCGPGATPSIAEPGDSKYLGYPIQDRGMVSSTKKEV